MQTVGEIVLEELREFRRETREELQRLEGRVHELESFRVKVMSLAATAGAAATAVLSYVPDWFGMFKGSH